MSELEEPRCVEDSRWWETVNSIFESGFTFFDFLTAIDRENETSKRDVDWRADWRDQWNVEVVARFCTPDLVESRMVSTVLDSQANVLASITQMYPGALWHEREVGEMFGVRFDGIPMDLLLRHEQLGNPPLLKRVILANRVVTPWPGAAEPDIKDDGRRVGNPSRRRQRPPGVPENWLAT